MSDIKKNFPVRFKFNSTDRDSFLHPKIIDPLLVPNFIRARVSPPKQNQLNPDRKGKGIFNNCNKTTEETAPKHSKRLIKPCKVSMRALKFKRTFSPPATDPISHSSRSQTKLRVKSPFQPSSELIKFNENRSKIQKKLSVSPVRAKTPQPLSPPPKRISTQIQDLLQSPINFSDKIAQNPQQVSFKILRSAILNQLKNNT